MPAPHWILSFLVTNNLHIARKLMRIKKKKRLDRIVVSEFSVARFAMPAVVLADRLKAGRHHRPIFGLRFSPISRDGSW